MAEILELKRDRLRRLRERGVDPFPPRFERTHEAAAVLDEARTPLGSPATVAGRLVQIREMGKASFAHIEDGSGRIQIYVRSDRVGADAYDFFKRDLHLGDFLGAQGKVFKTRTGETTLEAARLTLLAKAFRSPPEKWHGLKDPELRHRFRHLDLMASPEVRRGFEKRSRLVRAVRGAMDAMGFLEVETPVLLPQAGGAAATPFQTHHRALDRTLVLRIATELYLKRLIIGGFERVYEVGRIFRNEGVDTRHNPEFTMMEAYQAYADYHGMARLAEGLFDAGCRTLGFEEVEYRGRKLRLQPPFRSLSLPDLWRDACGEDIHAVLKGKDFDRGGLERLASRLGVEAGPATPSAKVFERIFDARILPGLWEPAFVLDHPTAITPLAKCKPGDESLVERFELFAGMEEIANAYTELNDPDDQRERLEIQLRHRKAGDAEADILDADFVEALEHGMPPTGGIGVGIDRMAMLFTGNPSIREVILFPALRPET